MTNFFSYVSLKTIVALFLDTHDKSYADADRCWILAWRALVDIFHSISAEPKTVRIPLNGNDTATLPSDYGGWMKIGVLNSNNTISTLRINNNLTLWKDTNSQYPNLQSDIQSPIENNSAFFPYYLNYYYNDYCYVLNAPVPEGISYAGECRVDEVNRVIVFDKKYQYPDVMLEYKAIPTMDKGDYQVETFWQEPIIAFIEWKLKLGDERSYYNRCIEARRKMPNKKVTLQVIEQMARYGNAYKIRI